MDNQRWPRAGRRVLCVVSFAVAVILSGAPIEPAAAYDPGAQMPDFADYLTPPTEAAQRGKAKVVINAPALRAAGSISYDAEGVPVVQAANELDAAYLLGYAHARDRFFQMDFLRRTASGTLAELVGSAALGNDVQIRTLGLRRAAFATWVALNDEARGILKAYADGVNVYLAGNPLPPEYGVLELTRVAPWTPVDSIALGKLLAFQLSFDLDIDFTLKLGAYQQAGAAGGFNGTALFFEDTHRVQPPDGRISIPGFAPSAKIATAAATSDAEAAPQIAPVTMALAQAYRDAIASHPIIGKALTPRDRRAGSNWWIIAGSETVSGRPILANDPHLGLDTPTLFEEVHIVAPNLNVVGASLPGTPFVLLGCNDAICWGLTVNPLDVTDVFQEQLVLNTFGLPTDTIYNGQREPVQTIVQLYNVNRLDGTADNPARDHSIGYLNGAVTVIVPRRNNGPLLSIQGSTALSVQYAGWGPTFELEAFRRINKARTLDEFRTAITYFDVGSQNFAYADTAGNIAYFTSAENPIRDDLQNLQAADGSVLPFLIRDGTGARRHQWLPVSSPIPNQALPYQVMPPSEMPFVINPAQGYIANANNDPVGNTLDNNALNQLRPNGGLYYLNFGYASYRMGRIDRRLQELIARAEKITTADVRALQANNQPLDAELVRPFLVQALINGESASAWADLRALATDPAIDEAVKRIEDWDLSTPTGIREGFDPGDNPANLPEPGNAEIENSVAATLFSVWRGQVVRNVMDATLTRIGLGSYQPSADVAYSGLKRLLETYPQRRGVGASGVNFFLVSGAPTPEAARDYLLLKSMRDALNLLAGSSFAAAYNGSTNQNDYRWGRLHRIVFDAPLGGPFNIPDANATYGFANLSAQLPGLARPGGYEVVDDSDNPIRANTVNGFMFTNGPARRFVGEMTSPIAAQQILPGGQSGVLGSPYYASQLGRWLTNNYKTLVLDVTTATTNPVTRLDFVPSP
jgi:penicillin amidase